MNHVINQARLSEHSIDRYKFKVLSNTTSNNHKDTDLDKKKDEECKQQQERIKQESFQEGKIAGQEEVDAKLKEDSRSRGS